MDILTKLQEFIAAGKAAALCTIIETSGSTPRKAGSKMIVTAEGKTIGSVGGGLLEKIVIKDAIDCISSGKTELKSYSSGNEDENRVYGQAKVFIEPLPTSKKLYIFGAGHVGQAVASLAKNYGFDINLIDHRLELMNLINIEGVKQLRMDYLQAINELPFDEDTYIIVTTHSHESDEKVTYACTQKPHIYLGMIGSRKKVEQAKQAFTAKGLGDDLIEKIDMPIGMPMNCETPDEIAISILAKLIHIKNS